MQFVKLPDVGVPNNGVVNVGEVANTTLPDPVVDAELAAVKRPCASTVMLDMVYDPADTAVLANATVGVVVPVIEIPVPPVTEVTGAVPLEAAIKRPCASTVNEL